MKKNITSVSLIAMMACLPSAFANNTNSSQDCVHHMKEHCAKNHKECMKKVKNHCDKMEEEEANRLNMLSILKNTPHINYEVRSIFIKGGKNRIKNIDSNINNNIASSNGDIDATALKIVPHDKDEYILSPLNFDYHGMDHNLQYNRLMKPEIPSVFGHHQLFSASNSQEYNIGTPHITINGGSLSLKKTEDKENNNLHMTPQEFSEIEETIKHDPELNNFINVNTIINGGRSLSIDIPRYKSVLTNQPIEAIYSFEDKLVEKTDKYKKHDVVNVKQVNVSGGVAMNAGKVNSIIMPYSKKLHGQDIILVKPTISLGTEENTFNSFNKTHANNKPINMNIPSKEKKEIVKNPHVDIH